MATPTTNGGVTPTTKAFENQAFLLSHPARNIRILCELEATAAQLHEQHVNATVLFFGSARAMRRSDWDHKHALLELREREASEDCDKTLLRKELARLASIEWMCEVYEVVADLAERLTVWALREDARIAKHASVVGVTRYHPAAEDSAPPPVNQLLYVCTGGGGGLMMAANEGASRVKGARNIGMGISLPLEEGVNPYVDASLAFEFHYFFTRKFWMAYHCEALVAVPGGFGTIDELFEVLTLKQTGKIQSDLPVVLLGTIYWKTVINWEVVYYYLPDFAFFSCCLFPRPWCSSEPSPRLMSRVSSSPTQPRRQRTTAEEAADYIIGRLSR